VADAAAGKSFSNSPAVTEGEASNDTPALPTNGTAGQTSGAHRLLGGAITVNDPALYMDTSAKVVNNLVGVAISGAFIRYAPCLILSQPYGLAVFPYGVNVSPTAVFIVPNGINIMPQGVNIAPTLIYVGPLGRNIAHQGFNVAPALISISPVYNVDFHIGKDVSDPPRVKTVALPRDGVGNTTVTYADGTVEQNP
jgi:hypothetical protein